MCTMHIYIYGMCDYTCFKYTIIYKWNQKDTEKNGVVCCSHHVQKKMFIRHSLRHFESGSAMNRVCKELQ